MDALRKRHLWALMPTSTIQNEHYALLFASTLLMRPVAQGNVEGLDIDSRHEQPGRASTFRLHKSIHIRPLVPLVNNGYCRLPFAHPDAPQDRLESDPMFIKRPAFYLGLGIGLLHFFNDFGQFF